LERLVKNCVALQTTGLQPAEPTIPYSTVKQPTARAG